MSLLHCCDPVGQIRTYSQLEGLLPLWRPWYLVETPGVRVTKAAFVDIYLRYGKMWCCKIIITLIFVMCHRSQPGVTPNKYERDGNRYFQTIDWYRNQRNGGIWFSLVTPARFQAAWLGTMGTEWQWLWGQQLQGRGRGEAAGLGSHGGELPGGVRQGDNLSPGYQPPGTEPTLTSKVGHLRLTTSTRVTLLAMMLNVYSPD